MLWHAFLKVILSMPTNRELERKKRNKTPTLKQSSNPYRIVEYGNSKRKQDNENPKFTRKPESLPQYRDEGANNITSILHHLSLT